MLHGDLILHQFKEPVEYYRDRHDPEIISEWRNSQESIVAYFEHRLAMYANLHIILINCFDFELKTTET